MGWRTKDYDRSLGGYFLNSLIQEIHAGHRKNLQIYLKTFLKYYQFDSNEF